MPPRTDLPSRDPRDIITPYAFRVEPRLLGIPLATPFRRGMAMLVDLVLLALLLAVRQISLILLGLVASWVLFRISSPGARDGVRGAVARPTVRAASVLLFLFTVIVLIGSCFLGLFAATDVGSGAADSGPGAVHAVAEAPGWEAARPVAPAETARSAEVEVPEGSVAARPVAAADRSRGVLAFLGSVADDLGFRLGWTGIYFTLFLVLWRGRTPGKRLLGIRVVRLNGEAIGWWAAFARFGGYAAGLATGLIGFLQIYWDANRQGIHDKVVGTVVIRDGAQSVRGGSRPAPSPSPTGSVQKVEKVDQRTVDR